MAQRIELIPLAPLGITKGILGVLIHSVLLGAPMAALTRLTPLVQLGTTKGTLGALTPLAQQGALTEPHAVQILSAQLTATGNTSNPST